MSVDLACFLGLMFLKMHTTGRSGYDILKRQRSDMNLPLVSSQENSLTSDMVQQPHLVALELQVQK